MVGRKSLVRAIEEWFLSPSPQSGLLLLCGKPGVGKSALLTHFIATHRSAKIVPLNGKFDQSVASRRGFSAVTEILSHLFSICASHGTPFREKLAEELVKHLKGTERALVNVCGEWAELFDAIDPLPTVTPEEEVIRINNAIATCLECVCDSLEFNDHSLCLIFGKMRKRNEGGCKDRQKARLDN